MGCGCQGETQGNAPYLGDQNPGCPRCSRMGCFTYKDDPSLGSLRDVPMPPDIERPQMWDTAAVVKAVSDGYTFMVPFISEKLFEPNAYWIKGRQASASNLTVGPEYTPVMELVENDWIQAKAFFPYQIVPETAWIGRPNERGMVAVYVEISPDSVDWELLNRGHQIRVRR